MSVIQFNTIGLVGKKYKLSELTPKHADGSIVEDANAGLTIQTFTSLGKTDKTYLWMGPNDDPDTYDKLGWYDKKDKYCGNVQLDENAGFMINSPFADGNLIFAVAGSVVMTEKQADIPNGYSLGGNSCAAEIKLSDITPKHADGSIVEDANAGLTIQTFTSLGKTDKTYLWMGPNDDPDTYDELGWYDKKDKYSGNVVFPAAKGFMINSPFTTGNLKFVYKAIAK